MKYRIIVFTQLLCLVVSLFTCSGKLKTIPVVSEALLSENIKNKLDNITIYSHLNESFKIGELKGQVYVVNFFFSSCTTICPAMERELKPLVNLNKNVMFLSFTIDPDKDTVQILEEHYRSIEVKGDNWLFLRTSKEDLEEIASLFLSTIKNNGDSFYHTSIAVLVDKKMKIRGLYDILEIQELDLLEEDLNLLLESS